MRNWEAFVRQHLSLPELKPERERRIVRELAEQLEDFSRDALLRGLTQDEADTFAERQIRDWECFASDVRSTDRSDIRPGFDRLADRTEEVAEAARATRGWGYVLADLQRNVVVGLRSLCRNPGFTAVVVGTLALGIGANTAIFTVVNGVLLRPLSYEDSDRLVVIRETKLPQFSSFSISPGNFESWRTGNTVFDQMSARRTAPFNLTGRGEPELLRGARVTAQMFAMLRAQPVLGRDFLPEEDQPGRDAVIILSHGLWQRRFGGVPDLIGQALTLSGRSYTVIGIMPPDFEFLRADIELWVPMAFTAEELDNHDSHYLRTDARLKDGVSLEQARTEMRTIASQLEQEFPESNTGWSVTVTPMIDSVVGDTRPALLVLLGAVGFVLLIACANVANMLLARATGRQKDIATRIALGAGRWRLTRQLLTESVLLGVAGGGAGLVLATWSIRVLPGLAPELPRLGEVALDGRALALTGALAVLTSVIFGLAPALHLSKPELTESLKEGGRGASGGRRRQRTRDLLVVTEIALALALLVGAGLLMRSFRALQQVDPGFNEENVLVVRLTLPESTYPENEQIRLFYRQLLERLSAGPGVRAAGVTQSLPFFDDMVEGFRVEGRPEPLLGERPTTNYYAVTPDYFSVMGIPLLRGRLFTDRDRQETPSVALINEALARQFFPDEDPIGQRIWLTTGPPPRCSVRSSVSSATSSSTASTPTCSHRPTSRSSNDRSGTRRSRFAQRPIRATSPRSFAAKWRRSTRTSHCSAPRRSPSEWQRRWRASAHRCACSRSSARSRCCWPRAVFMA